MAAKNAAENATGAAAALSTPSTKGDATEGTDATTGAGELKMRDLMVQVADRSGLRRSEVREALEMAMREIGDALADGRGVNLPGLGKVRIKQIRPKGSHRVIEARVRQDMRGAGSTLSATGGVAKGDD